MRRLILIIVSIVLGVATTLGVAAMALVNADKSSAGATTLFVRNGTELWIVRRLSSTGLEWVNCERAWPPLVNPIDDLVDIPAWAIPPERSADAGGEFRFATLAIGWPAPLAIQSWEATRPSEIFPLPVELDDGGDSLRRAAGRFLESDSRRPRRILWRGAIIDASLFTLAWIAILWLGALLARSLDGKQRDSDADEDEQRRGQAGHAEENLKRHDDHR